ncbi:MAG: response regulator [Thermodesulfobacteriota bacterium]
MATILVVEDEKVVLDVTSELIDLLGHHCLTAASLKETMAIFRQQTDIALVLLDRSLPDGDSLEQVAEMKRLQPAARIVICSGDPLEVGKTTGVDAYLAKPFTLEDLQEILHRFLPDH